jgi:linoleoyl-CoA desaturase
MFSAVQRSDRARRRQKRTPRQEDPMSRSATAAALAPPRTDSAAFASVLRARLDGYFKDRGISPKGDAAMAVKIAVGIGTLLAAYTSLFVFHLSVTAFVTAYVTCGLAQLFLLLNVTHDSNHNAVSRSRQVNRLLSLLMDASGVSSHIWRMLHHEGHHSVINVFGRDEAIFGRRLLRFSPAAPWRPMHRYQNWYAAPLYCLFSLDYMLMKDFEYLLFPREEPFKSAKHRPKDYAIFFAGKIFYLSTMFAAPILLGGYPAFWVLAAFLLVHLIAGLVSVVVFQTSHVIEETSFPADRWQYQPFVHHIFATTADYATRNPAVSWFTGGLNHHIVHHICPHVCHVHYPKLTPIVRETAREFGVAYREHPTVWEAFRQHLSLLKRLGAQA